MATIGAWNETVFAVSTLQVLTFDNYKRKTAHKFAEHNILNNINLLESIGQENEEISLTIQLLSSLGVDPKEEADILRAACREGVAEYLIIGSDVVGLCEWVLVSVEEKTQAYDGLGNIMQSELSLTFKQYGERDESLVNDVDIVYSNTGSGNKLIDFFVGKVKDWLKI